MINHIFRKKSQVKNNRNGGWVSNWGLLVNFIILIITFVFGLKTQPQNIGKTFLNTLLFCPLQLYIL